MPVLRGFVTYAFRFCPVLRVKFGELVPTAQSVGRSKLLLSSKASGARVLFRQNTMPPRKKPAAKATKEEPTKTAAPKTERTEEEEDKTETADTETKEEEVGKPAAAKKESKKRGQPTKEENGDEKEDAGKPAAKVAKKVLDGLTSMDFSSSAKTEDGRAWNLKIASWNVNGIRAWLNKDGLSYLKHEKPDILCVQETKCSDAKLPHEDLKVDGYKTFWSSAEKEGYAGTGIYVKTEPVAVTYGIGKDKHDDEGRVITAEFEKFYLVTAYVPNAGQGLVRLKYRTEEWDKDFTAYLKGLDEKKPVILCGDLNVAHLEIDLKNPKSNKRNAGFTDEERAGFGKLLEEGFIDSFRTLYPDKEEAYTFWSNLRQAREKNIGWRLDYFVLSEQLRKDLCDNIIRTHVKGSDHCPIVLLMAL